MDAKSLKVRTLDELRKLARAAGLRGYSGLRKNQLIELLVKPKASRTSHITPKKKAKSKTVRPKTAKTRGTPPSVRNKSSAVNSKTPIAANDAEERIESAKFQMTPPQTRFSQTFPPSLQEDIDNLSLAGESMLCLLPQKPGVVHAYWTLHLGAKTKPLRLRLCYATTDSIELLDEVDIRSERGHWYFTVPAAAELAGVFGHLGYYDAGGQFVTAIERGIARIPTLYASAKIDRSWWISDEDFRAMYQRAGGLVSGKRLLWSESSSSSSRHK